MALTAEHVRTHTADSDIAAPLFDAATPAPVVVRAS
jgi:hypothetical protein